MVWDSRFFRTFVESPKKRRNVKKKKKKDSQKVYTNYANQVPTGRRNK